jgi:DNA-binding NarL/FixJ family response regulator
MANIIKIMIVEDHDLFRAGLKRVIDEIDDLELVGEAENGAAFLQSLDAVDPDIVLMDIKMPVMDGIEATGRALKIKPSLKIIVLTIFGEEEYLYAMIQKGVAGFMLKSTSISELERAIKLVSEGQQYFSPEIGGMLAKKMQTDKTLNFKLTQKEKEVLQLLCQGYSSSEIAGKLFLGTRTIEGYRARLLQKTEQTNTLNLVIFALKNKLVPDIQ